MLELSKRLGICLGIAATFCLGACGDDDSSSDKGNTNGGGDGSVTCDSEEDCKDIADKPVCDPDKKICVEKKAEENQGGEGEGDGKCKSDADCKEDGKPKCDTASGECKAEESGGNENTETPALECKDGKKECASECIDVQTSNDHCGDCNKPCDTANGYKCEDGACKAPEVAVECQDTEQPSCVDDTHFKKCVSGAYVTDECPQNQTCNNEDGTCKANAECSDSDAASCDGNAVKKCVNGAYVTTSCDDKTCEDGACTQTAFVKQCENDEKPTCDDNQVKKCVNNVYVMDSCGSNTCEDGECTTTQAVAECDETTAAECVAEGLKKCVNKKFVTTPCEEGQVCKDGECQLAAATCPADWTGDKEADTDEDGVKDCLDQCPNNKFKQLSDGCDCDHFKFTIDGTDFCAEPIYTAADFINMRDGLITGDIRNSSTTVFALIQDIDLGDEFPVSETDWDSVTGFRGKLVSDGKTIKFTNGGKPALLNCVSDKSCGLFNSLSGARIHNIKFNFNIKGKSGVAKVGMLAGNSDNAIISMVEVKGDVTGDANYIGGMIGYTNNTTMSDITRSGNVMGSKTTGTYIGGVIGASDRSKLMNVKAGGSVTGYNRVGGVEGYYATGVFSDIEFDGEVTGINDYVGGICGFMDSSVKISNIVSKGIVNGNRLVGGVFGRTTSSMENVTNEAQVLVLHNFGTNAYAYAGAVIGQLVGGASFKNIHNKGPITVDCSGDGSEKCKFTGGVVGILEHINSIILFENVTNEAQVEATKNSMTAGIIGFVNGTIVKMKNVENSGTVIGVSKVGGIIGDAELHYQYDAIFENVVNKGKITAYGGDVGGIIGNIVSGVNTSFENVYSTGDIEAFGSNIGGIIGYWCRYGECEDHSGSYWYNAAAPVTKTFKFNKVYSSGKISATGSVVGGIIGRMHGDGYNRHIVQTGFSCVNDNGTSGTKYRNVYTYRDDTTNIEILNSGSECELESTGTIGGLIGYYYGNSRSIDTTTRTKECTLNEEKKCSSWACTTELNEPYKRISALTITNSYAAGVLNTNNAKYEGGLVGHIDNNDQLGANQNLVKFDNCYSTSKIDSNMAGAFIGRVEQGNLNFININNAYYWTGSGSNNFTAAGLTSDKSFGFDYDSDTPKISGNKLLDKLNLNIKGSTALKAKAINWSEKEFSLDGSTYKIPYFGEIGPQKEASSEEGEGENR